MYEYCVINMGHEFGPLTIPPLNLFFLFLSYTFNLELIFCDIVFLKR
jgi:hypothetical protein